MEWYTEISADSPISQGDIFFKCPIFIPDPNFDYTNLENLKDVKIRMYTSDVIVMTQACDLAHDPPVDLVVAAIGGIREDDSWQEISEINSGRRPAYHLISKKETGDIKIDYKIVDFTSIYNVRFDFLEQYKVVHGNRLRLNSPYLEFLAQRFGSYFSRIGLPINIDKTDLKKCHKMITEKNK